MESQVFAQFELELFQKSEQDKRKQGSWQAAAAQFRSLIKSVRKAEGKTLAEFLREDPLQPDGSTTAEGFRLTSYPNPFNPSTIIRYELPQATHVVLKVYDIVGREQVLINAQQNGGPHSVVFDGTQLGSSIYFVKLETPNHSQILRVLLLK